MNPKARFIISIIDTARTCDTELPWSRGDRRVEFISRRTPEARARLHGA